MTIPDGGGSISIPEGLAGAQRIYQVHPEPDDAVCAAGNAMPVVKTGDAMPAGEIWLRVIPRVRRWSTR